MIKGMKTCKVCGRDFPLLFEEHYVAQDPQKIGAIANLVNNDRAFEFDAFDCPHCGCQNVMQGRKPVYYESISEEDDTQSTKSCANCVYVECGESEEPCSSCNHNYVEKWEEKQ